jgi:hypothetical protein
MQDVGKVTSPSPDIVLIQAQGRTSDAVHQDVQQARWDAKQARETHDLGSASTLSSPVKNKLMAMMQEAHAKRDMLPGSPNPAPDAPCPIP